MGSELNDLDDDDWGAYAPELPRAAKPRPAPKTVRRGPGGDAPAAADRVSQPAEDVEPSAAIGDGPAAMPHKRKLSHFPAFVSRSAMFRASSSDGSHGPSTPVKAQGCVLKVSGPKLDMRDKLVWETAVQLAKERAEDAWKPFEIELRDFARRMGSKAFGGRNLKAIGASLARLAKCRVDFEIGESCKGVGALVATFAEEQGRFYIRMNPDFVVPALMGDKQFLMNRDRRAKLASGLAQWLHDFFSTHAQARAMDLGYLRELSGCDTPARNFPARLRKAMRQLEAAAPEVVSGFEVKKVGRRSARWILAITKGGEKPSFLPAQAPAPQKPKRAAGKGGVAL